MRNRRRALLALTTVGALALGACGGDDSGSSSSGATTTAGSGSATTAAPAAGATTLPTKPVDLSLVAFSAPKAGHEAAQKVFKDTPAGKGVSWTPSYGASGDQSRAVVAGLKADVVHFSLEGDVTRLVDAGLVAKEWNAGETKGIVTDSVVVIVVRKGNPKKITGWDDIVKDGIGIVTPNPGSSGSARWNILAAWAHVISNGGTEAEATDYLTKFFDNTVSLPGSARDATTAFTGGTGDVLLSYENEAILARQSGADFDYIIPDTTLLIENPGAVTTKADPRAQAYLDFLESDEGQEALATVGFRPIDDTLEVGEVKGANNPKDPYPAVKDLATITDDFGGWSATNKKFFAEDGIVTKIQAETGKS